VSNDGEEAWGYLVNNKQKSSKGVVVTIASVVARKASEQKVRRELLVGVVLMRVSEADEDEY
jgi:hypothetical protein